jgi:hypothetical protein
MCYKFCICLESSAEILLHIYTNFLQVGGGGYVNLRLTNLLCKKIIIAKSKRVEIGCSFSRDVWQNHLRNAMAQKGLVRQ